jgi:hypothetical protein
MLTHPLIEIIADVSSAPAAEEIGKRNTRSHDQ